LNRLNGKRDYYLRELKKQIKGNFSNLFVGESLSNILAFLTTIYLARKLTDQGFGLWAFMQSIIAYLVIFVDLGLSTFGTREIAKSPNKAGTYLANIFAIRSLMAIVIIFIVVFFVSITTLSHEMKMLLVLGSLWLISQALNPDFFFQGLERMRGVAAWRILWRLFYLIPVLFFIKARTDLWLVPIFYSLSGILTVFVIFPFIKIAVSEAIWKKIKPTEWLKYIKISIVMAASVFVIKIYYSFDTFMLGLIDSPEAVGWYQAAFKIITLFIGIAVLIQIAFAPYFSNSHQDVKKLKIGFRYICFVGAIMGGFFTIAIIVLSEKLINVLYGVQYFNSINVLMLLALTVYLIFLELTYLSSMNYIGMHKQYLNIVLSGAIINILLNAILIPLLSTKGAAISTVLSNLFILSVSILVIKNKQLMETFVFRIMVKSAISLGAVLLFLYFLAGNFIVTALSAWAFYFLLFMGISWNELKYFKFKEVMLRQK
jgi:polysaccharide transporter, PST family